MRNEIRVKGLSEPISHYADAVQFGNLLFVSGVVPLDDSLKVVSEDVAVQAHQVLSNMAKVLAAAGANFADVLKVTVYLLDVRDRVRINPVRQEFFGRHRPASTLIGVKELALPGIKVEIDAVVGLRT